MKLFEVTNTTGEIWKLQSTNQYNMGSEWHWFVPCDLQIFSGCVCHLEQLHTQSPFLFPIVFSINYHMVTCSFDGYSSFLFSFGSGLGVRDPRPRIGIVICPLFPFWRAGRPGWKHSTGGSSIISPLMARGLSSERALRRRPSSHFPFAWFRRFPPCV